MHAFKSFTQKYSKFDIFSHVSEIFFEIFTTRHFLTFLDISRQFSTILDISRHLLSTENVEVEGGTFLISKSANADSHGINISFHHKYIFAKLHEAKTHKKVQKLTFYQRSCFIWVSKVWLNHKKLPSSTPKFIASWEL